MTIDQNYNNFDWIKYITYYNDLKKHRHLHNKHNAWNHWIKHGKNENRRFFTLNEQHTYIDSDFFEKNYTIYITRYINNKEIAQYWKNSYDCIRNLYKNINIVIIDDSSNEEFIAKDNDISDVTFFYSQQEKKDDQLKCEDFTKKGEILPFYYFYKYGTTPYAVFIHDSVFINKAIHDNIYEDDFLSFWSFNTISWYKRLYSQMNNFINVFSKSKELTDIWKRPNLWEGTFGSMCVISSKYLNELEKEYGFLSNGLSMIQGREERMLLERLLSIFYFSKHSRSPHALFSNIHIWCMSTFGKSWGLKWSQYKSQKRLSNVPIIKIWSGRGLLLPGEEFGLR